MRLPSLIQSRRALAAVAVSVAAAACSDAGTAPRPATVSSPLPTSAQPETRTTERTLVTIKIKDSFGIFIPEKPILKFVFGTDSTLIQDNTAADKDLTPGIMTVALPWKSTYKACLYQDTKTFGIDVTLPTCNSAAGSAPLVDLGTLVMRHFPNVWFFMRDKDDLTLFPGATVKLVAPPGDGFSSIVNDGGPHDADGVNDGDIWMRGNRPGTYTWCEVIPPLYHILPVPSCGTLDMKWDWVIYVDVLHGKKWTVSSSGN